MRGYLAWDDAHLDDGLSVEFRYTEAYRQNAGRGLASRELACLRVALPAAAAPVTAMSGQVLLMEKPISPASAHFIA